MAQNKGKNPASEEGEIDEIFIVLFSDEEIRRMSPSNMEAFDKALSNSNPTGEKWCRGKLEESTKEVPKRSRTTSTATQISNGVHRKIVKPQQKSLEDNNPWKAFTREMPKVAGKLSETAAKINTALNKVNMEAFDKAPSISNPAGGKSCRVKFEESTKEVSKRSRTTSTATQMSNGMHRKIVKPQQKSLEDNNPWKAFTREMPKVAGKLSEALNKVKKSMS
ncbi:unnamed protein product [Hermetia illucens]|uniref:Uncharacterized protein n=1 Tax=Hermetia illucens TaxID=343691 RepID=A0A7R8YWE3_HERIL|nr:unnamed protein product [Hermetia illucens]